MGIVSRLIANCRRWFRRLSARRANEGEQFNWPTGLFVSLDPYSIADDLDLLKKAELNGTHGLPSQADTEFDGPQQAVIVEINSGVATTIADANVRVVAFTNQIRAVNVERDVRSLQELPDALARSTENWLEKEGINDALPQLRERFKSAQDALQQFKQRHGLGRPPMEVDRRFSTAAILFFLVLQILINANFFAYANPRGFLGGVTIAGLFALLDIVVAFLLGNSVRQCNRRELLYRVQGWMSVSVAVFWCLCFNLFVAHYRMAMQSQYSLDNPAFNPLLTAFRSVVESPFYLTELPTVLLFAFGLLLSIVVAISGFKWDDPFPGYGKLGKCLWDAKDDLDSVYGPARDFVRGEYQQCRDKIETLRRDIRDALTDLQFQVETKRSELKNLRGFLDDREQVANALLSIYRDANRRARPDRKPAPAYFQQRYKVKRPAWMVDDMTGDTDYLAAQEQKAKETRQMFKQVETRLKGVFEELLGNFKTDIGSDVENKQ